MLQPLPHSKAEQTPTALQHALDLKSPPTRIDEQARDPEIGQDIVPPGCQGLAVCARGVADGEVGVVSVRGRSQGDLEDLGAARPSGIEDCFGRDAQGRVRQGFGGGGDGAAEVDEEDLVAGCSCQWREGDARRYGLYTGTGSGAISRNSTSKSCFARGTRQNVALLCPGIFSVGSVIEIDAWSSLVY